MSLKLHTIYFYTATIKEWKNLLEPDRYKDIIINSLKYLVDKKKLAVYGLVIMPNHIHIIWELLAMNGKEKPHASFMKFTSHEFLNEMRMNHPEKLQAYEVESVTRDYNFWQRDPLPIELYTRSVVEQKLIYIHNNPLQEHWNLCQEPEQYKYSSALFYATGVDPFGILTHYMDRI